MQARYKALFGAFFEELVGLSEGSGAINQVIYNFLGKSFLRQ